MARKKKKVSPLRIGWLVAIILLIVAGVLAWQYRKQLQSAALKTGNELALPQQAPPPPSKPLSTPTPTSPAPATSNPAMEEKPAHQDAMTAVSGKLQIRKPPRDTQLGVSAADAVVLLRSVAMYQWQEHCDGDACRYENVWTEKHIDSTQFHTPAGHENPKAPFADARFFAGEVKIGDLLVDPGLIAAQHAEIDYPIKPKALPPNLAATFSVVNGALYAGGDAGQPQVGTIRISYKIVPGGDVSLSGVKHGAKLEAH